MTLLDTLRALAAADIHLRIESDSLKYRAPPGAMTPVLRDALAEHKATVTRLIPTPAGALLIESVRGELTFGELAVEVALQVPGAGEVWLVPRATGRHRVELTPGDLTAMALVQVEFPGARVVSMQRPVRVSPANLHEPEPPDSSLAASV